MWEPCGGILCANVPIIYTTFCKAAKDFGESLGRGFKSKSTGQRPLHSRSGSDSGDNRQKHTWAQLNDSGAAISSKVSADKPTEMNNLNELGGILVQRELVTNSLYAPSSDSAINASKRRNGEP